MNTVNLIGTRNESSLHKTLKFQYTGPGGKTEAKAGDFVADGVRADGEYIEVQTGSFGPLRKKIKTLAAGKKAKIRIIHPIAVNKYIEVYEPAKRKKPPVFLYRRKSPKKGSIWSLFDALMYAPELALTPGVTIEAVLVDVTEIRIKDGSHPAKASRKERQRKRSRRRKEFSIIDRKLSAWHENIVFKKPKDYLRFIPFKKGEEFTTAALAARAAINTDTARMALYVLTKIGIVTRIGKQGQAWVYVR